MYLTPKFIFDIICQTYFRKASINCDISALYSGFNTPVGHVVDLPFQGGNCCFYEWLIAMNRLYLQVVVFVTLFSSSPPPLMSRICTKCKSFLWSFDNDT